MEGTEDRKEGRVARLECGRRRERKGLAWACSKGEVCVEEGEEGKRRGGRVLTDEVWAARERKRDYLHSTH